MKESIEKKLLRVSRNYEAVAVGVSTGGLEALKRIVPRLPEHFNRPVFIVYHTHKTSDDFLVRHLNQISRLRVKQAEDKETIKPGVVYIAPPDYHLLIEWDKTIALSTDELVNYTRPSIDVLFETAADVYGEKLIGIILTGANKDGSIGAKKIKAAGGLVVVQDPKTAEIDTMPKAAIEAVEPKLILSLDEIAEFLCNLE
jgi:two-component system, chemotaxis family, protein-glutamate methylesterase/glutaminase